MCWQGSVTRRKITNNLTHIYTIIHDITPPTHTQAHRAGEKNNQITVHIHVSVKDKGCSSSGWKYTVISLLFLVLLSGVLSFLKENNNQTLKNSKLVINCLIFFMTLALPSTRDNKNSKYIKLKLLQNTVWWMTNYMTQSPSFSDLSVPVLLLWLVLATVTYVCIILYVCVNFSGQ